MSHMRIQPRSLVSSSSSSPSSRSSVESRVMSVRDAFLDACKSGNEESLLQLVQIPELQENLRLGNEDFEKGKKAAEDEGHYNITTILKKVEKVNFPDVDTGGTELMNAIQKVSKPHDHERQRAADEREAVAMIQTPGANVNAKNRASQTVLMIASMGTSVAVVEALLALPFLKVNEVNESDETALMLACQADEDRLPQPDIIGALVNHLDLLAEILAHENLEGETALDLAPFNMSKMMRNALKKRTTEVATAIIELDQFPIHLGILIAGYETGYTKLKEGSASFSPIKPSPEKKHNITK